MSRLWRALRNTDEGMSTVEYCVGLIAACTLAGVLLKILSGDWVAHLIKAVIEKAFSFIGLG